MNTFCTCEKCSFLLMQEASYPREAMHAVASGMAKLPNPSSSLTQDIGPAWTNGSGCWQHLS